MMSKFEHILFSEKYNQAKSQLTNGKRVVYIEDISDKCFWSLFFDLDKYEITLYQNKYIVTGKSVLKKIYAQCHAFMLCAVDADYDYLCENNCPEAKVMCENPFVIHTHAYSLESVKYNVDYMNTVLKQVKLYENSDNFSTACIFERLSELLYPLLVHYFYSIEHSTTGEEISDLNKIVEDILDMGDLKWMLSEDCYLMETYFEQIEDKVKSFIEKLPDLNKGDMVNFIQKLNKKGLDKKNAYQFIQGHTLENKVVYPLFYAIHYKRKDNEAKKYVEDYEESQRNQRIGQIYRHFDQQCDIRTLLTHQIEKLKEIDDAVLRKIRQKITSLH